jgi:hypothetical protein
LEAVTVSKAPAIDSEKADDAKKDAALEAERLRLQSKVKDLEDQIAIMDSPVEEIEEVKEKKDPARIAMEGFASLLKDPEMKKAMKDRQKSTLGYTHGALFKSMSLSPEKMDKFKELLLEKNMAGFNMGINMMGGQSSEERAESQKLAAEKRVANDEQMKELLSEEDYNIYRQYEDTQEERNTVSRFKRALPAEEKISEEQEHKLILSMQEERTAFEFSTGLQDRESFNPETLTEESVNTHMEETAELQEKQMTRAKEILTGPQTEQLGKNMERQRNMQKFGMNMAVRMFNRPAATPEVPSMPSVPIAPIAE